MFAAKDTLLTRPSGGYQISRSLRFNPADSAYLGRTPSITGSTTKLTFSAWVKKSGFAQYQTFGITANATLGRDSIRFADNETIQVFLNEGNDAFVITTAVYRDPSAWYHIVVAIDTTQATALNRVRIYINNVEVTAFNTATYPTQNYAFTGYNVSGKAHQIGRSTANAYNLDGYMAEINYVDGQQLTPSSFGSTNADTGVWQPKAFSGGAYGTNGFYVNFLDNSNTTAATLGKDYSGNGNNWTPNNFSVSAGAGNDSLVDSPTSYGTDTGVGGNVRGNYCTLNPLSNGGATLANGNLQFSFASPANWITCNSTMGMSSGKWYWEVSPTSTGGTLYCQVGINRNWANDLAIPLSSNVYGYSYSAHNGNKGNNGAGSAYGSTWTVNDIIGIAFDADAGTLTFYKNNTSQGAAYSGLASGDYVPAVSLTETQTAYINLGQRAFAYTAPSGYKALCTQNLPTPTIGATTATQAGKYFNPVLWTGNGASTRAITGVGFQPDFTWIKKRDEALSHLLYDAVRTAGINKALSSNDANIEPNVNADATYGYLSSFDSDGISVARGTNGTVSYTNANSGTYVAWNWKANGTGSTNTSGTITSTVSANTTSGFSIVTYTGTGAVGATVGHGLGVIPSMIIQKVRNTGTNDDNWHVYHASIGATGAVFLNLTAVTSTSNVWWNNIAPTSSVFTVGGSANTGYTNYSTATYVAYCFAPIAGYSAFGSYTGNGSADGPFVFTGMRPAFVMVKRTDSTGDWWIYDTARSTYNAADKVLFADTSAAEITDSNIDLLSNGFKFRTATYQPNTSGGTFIYIAFASNPFKYSLAR